MSHGASEVVASADALAGELGAWRACVRRVGSISREAESGSVRALLVRELEAAADAGGSTRRAAAGARADVAAHGVPEAVWMGTTST